jgi:hypothetical protein
MKTTSGWFERLSIGCTIATFAFALVLSLAPSAQAEGVVSTCDEASLRTALNSGGLVTFACSGMITLTLTSGGTITVSSDTTIDGSGQNVTISGGNHTGVFSVPLGVKLNLKRLTIAGGSGAHCCSNSNLVAKTRTFVGGE